MTEQSGSLIYKALEMSIIFLICLSFYYNYYRV